jgi:hypothetical protein
MRGTKNAIDEKINTGIEKAAYSAAADFGQLKNMDVLI